VTTIRSNATPFSIAARVDAPALTATPLLLPDASGVFKLSGAGFSPGKTEVLLGVVPLTATSGTLAAGQFAVAAGGNEISFIPPGTLTAGQYEVRIRVNQVDSAPAWWIQR